MTQHVEFGGLLVAYDDRILTPRAWTQRQSQWAAEILATAPPGDVLELCCGAGQIGLLAVRGSGRRLVCVDVDPVAGRYASDNAARAGVGVHVRTGRARDVIGPRERFPMIIADPPWVEHAHIGTFPEDPALAIDGGPDGLQVVAECVDAIVKHLAPGGTALLQLAPGGGQADAVSAAVRGTHLRPVERRSYPRGTLLRLDA